MFPELVDDIDRLLPRMNEIAERKRHAGSEMPRGPRRVGPRSPRVNAIKGAQRRSADHASAHGNRVKVAGRRLEDLGPDEIAALQAMLRQSH